MRAMKTYAKKKEYVNAPAGPFTMFSHCVYGYNIRKELVYSRRDAEGAENQYDDLDRPEKDFLAWVNRLETLMHVRDCMIDTFADHREIRGKNSEILGKVLCDIAGGKDFLSILPFDWMERGRVIVRSGLASAREWHGKNSRLARQSVRCYVGRESSGDR